MTRERWAQIGITVQFLIVVRTLAEFFRLRHVLGTTFSAAVAAPYVGGALIAVCFCCGAGGWEGPVQMACKSGSCAGGVASVAASDSGKLPEAGTEQSCTFAQEGKVSGVANLKGWFGFYRFGTNFLADPITTIASVGYIFFDGAGNTIFSQQTSAQQAGAVAPFANPVPNFPPPGNGSYTVDNGGSTFVLYETPGDLTSFIAQGVIVDDGNGLYAQSTMTGRAVFLIARRLVAPKKVGPPHPRK